MEVCVTFDDSPAIKDSLTITDKLGEGKFTTYEAYSPSHHALYCLKVFPRDEYGGVQYQKERTVANLCHRNVIQYVPLRCHESEFRGIATEVAKYGDFFDFTTKGFLATETLIRTYFHQLIAGVEHIHSQGFAHLDLKLENLMIGSKFTLKIIDFDQAQSINDTAMTSAGTEQYRAPEVIDKTCENLSAVDVFSAGVILYSFITREFPFSELEDSSNEELCSYKSFVKHNKDFWIKKSENMGAQNIFTKDLIRLINGMLHPDPAKRFSLKEVKTSEWFIKPVLDEEDLRTQIKGRWRTINSTRHTLQSLA